MPEPLWTQHPLIFWVSNDGCASTKKMTQSLKPWEPRFEAPLTSWHWSGVTLQGLDQQWSSNPMSMSEAFSVPFYALIKPCYTKALEWSSLVPGPKAKSSSLEIRNPTSFTVSCQPSHPLIAEKQSKDEVCNLKQRFERSSLYWSPSLLLDQ